MRSPSARIILPALLFAAWLGVSCHQPLKAAPAKAQTPPPPAAPAAQTEPAPKADSEADPSEIKIGEVTLARVFRSEPAQPAWIQNPKDEESADLLVLGKGNSLRSAFEAQQAAVHEAVGAMIRRQFGASIRYKTSVEVAPAGERLLVRVLALVWFENEPTKVGGFTISGVYHEVWEGNGQQVYVAWVRVNWPKSERERLLKEHSV